VVLPASGWERQYNNLHVINKHVYRIKAWLDLNGISAYPLYFHFTNKASRRTATWRKGIFFGSMVNLLMMRI
jgi:hypothetical protein